MKTKPFLLATAGSTVDGRVIDDKMLEEMASSYNPLTYDARLNIEHIRGVSGDGPFRAYGDVLELSLGDTEVDFNGKKEKRKALFGVFDVNDDAKKLNDAGQKMYPSIEIFENFGGKGFAYLAGCALTDSPAAIATQRLKFNRHLPGTIKLSGETALPFELADAPSSEGGGGFLAGLTSVLDGFAAKFTKAEPAKLDPAPAVTAPPAASQFDFAQLRPLFEEMGKSLAASVDALRGEMRSEVDSLAVKLKKLEDVQEATPATGFRTRPQANGNGAKYARTDC